MKKLYLQFLSTFFTGTNGQTKAVKILLAFTLSCISYSGFGQVVVSPANDTIICSKTAVGGSAPACSTLGTITLTETANSDFASGPDQIVLTPPAGWQFCTTAPTYAVTPGGDVSSASGIPTSGSLVISITSGGVSGHDVITITGLKVQPLTTSAPSGIMYASSTTGVTGVVTGPGGTSFGKLGVIPAPITAASGPLPSFLCTNTCVSLMDAITGGTWSSSNPTIATVNPLTGLVCPLTPGSVVITYSVTGCATSDTFNVSAGPKPILNVHNMCAWYDSIVYIIDSTPGGLFSSTGVTTFQVSMTPGKAIVKANASGGGGGTPPDTIFYQISTGCRTYVVLTVNPLPKPFTPAPYRVCQGSSITLYDSICCGTFSSSVTTIDSVRSFGGDSVTIYGINPGISILTYSLTATGCKTDTPIKVDSIPQLIMGPSQVCSLSTITLTDATPGGIWSSSLSSIATINMSTGDVTGVSPGTTVIFYTLPTGCLAITSVTVDPLPDSITGPAVVCVGATITLSDPTGGGRWVSSNGTAAIDSISGVVTGVSGGVDTIYYSILPGNCKQQYIINVNPEPSPIIGPTELCQGSATTYSDTTLGGSGTWSATPATVGSIDPTTGVFTAVSPGVVTVCYTLSSTTGCQICETVTVDLTPGPISGATHVCVGDSTQLTDGTPGGIWTTSDPTVAIVDTFTGYVTGVSGGPCLISYTVGVCSAIYAFTVNPYPTPIVGLFTLCVGDTVTYSDAVTGGTWGVSNTSATINPTTGFLTAVSSGSVVLSYTVAGGCQIDTSVIIQARDTIAGPNHVCQGDTICLTNSVSGGTWSQSIPLVLFISPTGLPSAHVCTKGLLPGGDIIYYTLPTGCMSKMALTVYPITPISTSVTQECVGDSVTLTDATPGGTWSDAPGTFGLINAFSGVIKGISAGVESVTYTITTTGCFATAPFTVNALPAAITGLHTVCQMDSVQLTETSTGGIWTASNGHASIDTAGWVTGITTGVDTITWSYNATSCKVSFVVTVNPLAPILGPDSVCVGDSIILTNADTVGVWSHLNFVAGTMTSDTTTAVYHGLAAGGDSVIYTMNGTGCRFALSVTVNGLPGPIHGSDSLCVGTTDSLSDDSTGGHWTSHLLGIATIGSATGVALGVGPGVDSITYTRTTGCKTSITITVDPNPAPIVGPPFNVCLGHDTTLSDPTAGGVWSSTQSSITPITTVGANGKIHGASLGVDSVYYTLPVGGCFARLAVTVTPIPVITTNHPNIKCRYSTVRLWADSNMTGRTYVWTPSYGLNNAFVQSPLASPTVTTTYTVVGTDSHTGCDGFATVTVVVDDSLDHLMIVGRDSICDGGYDTLMASGRAGSMFDWHPYTALTCTICDTTVAHPDATTTYWAVAVDDLGCKDSVSFTVVVNPIPVIQVSPNPTILCKRTPLQVTMSTTNTDNSTTTWAWSPNLFLSCDSCRNPILTDSQNIVYNVIGTSIYGCYDSFKVKVSVLDTNVNGIVTDTNICIGGAATLRAFSHSVTSNLDVPTFLWMPNYALSSPDSSFTFANPAVTTTYSVAIRENACFSDTLAVTVYVQPYPVINLSPPNPTQNVAGTPTQLTALVKNTPVLHYLWHPASTLTCDTCYNPVAIPTVSTTYVVTVTSIWGCTTQDSVTIQISCDQSQVFIPNTFTPNGDGVNDRFYVSAKGIKVINNLSVYNRWGQLVFQALNVPPNDPAAGWDGTFKGLVLEPDVFVYVVEATCELGGPPMKYKGDVSIVK